MNAKTCKRYSRKRRAWAERGEPHGVRAERTTDGVSADRTTDGGERGHGQGELGEDHKGRGGGGVEGEGGD